MPPAASVRELHSPLTRGVYYAGQDEHDNLILVVINSAGRWLRVVPVPPSEETEIRMMLTRYLDIVDPRPALRLIG